MPRVGQGEIEKISIPAIKRQIEVYRLGDDIVIVGVPPKSDLGYVLIDDSGWKYSEINLGNGIKTMAIWATFDQDTLKALKTNFTKAKNQVLDIIKDYISDLSAEQLKLYKDYEPITKLSPIVRPIHKVAQKLAPKHYAPVIELSQQLMNLYQTQDNIHYKIGNQLYVYGTNEYVKSIIDQHKLVFKVVLQSTNNERLLMVLDLNLQPPVPKQKE